MYDGLLNMEPSRVTKLIGYAGDFALIMQEASTPLIEIVANDSLSRISRWLHKFLLKLVVGKSEHNSNLRYLGVQ